MRQTCCWRIEKEGNKLHFRFEGRDKTLDRTGEGMQDRTEDRKRTEQFEQGHTKAKHAGKYNTDDQDDQNRIRDKIGNKTDTVVDSAGRLRRQTGSKT